MDGRAEEGGGGAVWLASSSLQHITESLTTQCMLSIHKQLQQVRIGSSVLLFTLPLSQSLSPVWWNIVNSPVLHSHLELTSAILD